MKYAITGGAGHISKPLSEKLLAAGHSVTVIGRNAENLKELVAKGATAAIGSVEDVDFLTKAFAGADAVYTMVPPNYATTDLKTHIGQVGKNYAEAIAANGIKFVVNLSSIGADLPDGCGPVSGLYRAEQALNKLSNVNIKHLRAPYFFDNFFGNIDLIKNAGIMGGNFTIASPKFPVGATSDIAEVVAEELLNLSFTGQSVRYIASDEIGTADVAVAIGKAIGKPDLPWISFSDADALNGMLQAGLPEEIAKNYVEMGAALNTGIMQSDYLAHRPASFGKVKLNDFASAFAAAYKAN